MDRRRFLLTSLAGALAAPLAAEAQARNVRRIGFLSASSPEASREAMEEFRRGLRERGYVEGQNIQIEYRWAEGNSTRLSELVLELIRLKPELIVAVASPAARAAHQATRTIPIVIVGVGNPGRGCLLRSRGSSRCSVRAGSTASMRIWGRCPSC